MVTKKTNNSEQIESPVLTLKEAAQYLRVPANQLKTWRYKGIGPKYIKKSERIYVYRKQDLNEFIERQVIIPKNYEKQWETVKNEKDTIDSNTTS